MYRGENNYVIRRQKQDVSIVTDLNSFAASMTECKFLIRHWSSGKYVHPLGGKAQPAQDTRLVLYDGWHAACTFRLVPCPDTDWYYIQHVSSGKFVHTYGGKLDPTENCQMVIYSGRHAACLFFFDSKRKTWMHVNGKFAHPSGGSSSPENDTHVVLHRGHLHNTKWELVDEEGRLIGIPNNKPKLQGYWQVIHAILNPRSTHTVQYKVKIGRSLHENREDSPEWVVDLLESKNWFKASTEYAELVKLVSVDTFDKEYEETRSLTIIPGASVVNWQFVFEATRGSSKCCLRATYFRILPVQRTHHLCLIKIFIYIFIHLLRYLFSHYSVIYCVSTCTFQFLVNFQNFWFWVVFVISTNRY